MSSWTHIRGTVDVMPYGRTQAEKRYILETVLAHLPKVTGSEENMHTHIVQCSGYNYSSNTDEFGLYQDETVEMQDNYMVVLEGNFRDRHWETTFHEFMKWLQRLCKRVLTMGCVVSISEDDCRTYTVVWNTDQCMGMFEDYSWCGTGAVNWTEYLMWREPRNDEDVVICGKPDFVDGKLIEQLTAEERAKRIPIHGKTFPQWWKF